MTPTQQATKKSYPFPNPTQQATEMSNPPLEEQAVETPAPNPTVAAVHIKIPPFWAADPMIWFAQVEAQFSTRRITAERTKFDFIVASLAPEYALEIRDLILNPPSTKPYTMLKEQLVLRTAASEQRRLQQLFNAEDLGDRKPTQLLRRMQQLLGDKYSATDTSFLRELFLQRLPGTVRMVLASIDSKDPDELAQTADKILEVAAPTVASVSSVSPEVSQLCSEIGELRKLIEQLLAPPRQPRRSRTPHRSPSPKPATTSDQPPICWYHQCYGTAARKCLPPCSSGNDQASR